MWPPPDREAAEMSFRQVLYCLGRTHIPPLHPGRNNAVMPCEMSEVPF